MILILSRHSARLIAAVLFGSISFAENALEIQCLKSGTFLAPVDSPAHRKYAPDREIDILHLALDVTPDFSKRTVRVQTIIQFQPIAKPLGELALDAVDLDFSFVTATEKIRAYQVSGRKLIVTFANPIPPGTQVSLTTRHTAEPSEGLYFRTPEMGYKEGESHLFTQGEAIEARHWYPCFDAPNEKFTSEITCRVPQGMTVLSNGRLMSESKESASGLVAVRWLQDKPHVNYLISLVAGYFEKIEERHGDIPMAFYTLPSAINEAANSARNTKSMMAYFEQEIGVPYPWHKYFQVCVNDFVAGGMENTSITTLTDRTLFAEATENIRSSDGLVAHELAHQWFGDLVTCKDWSHLWLNEGFATYYAHLFDGFQNGRDSMLYGLYKDAQGMLGRASDTKPIVDRKYNSPDDQFSFLAYQKGSWVLHMLRSQLGDELYRDCIRTYLERHAYGNVVTEDLNSVVEEISGRSFDQFFDQWVYHAHHPELNVRYSWDEKSRLAKLSVGQVQKLGEDVLLFNFPVTVRFKSALGTVDREIQVTEKDEDFYFPLENAPDTVRFDSSYTLLAKIQFSVPNPMLHAQLGDTSDMIGRLLAVEQLASKTDSTSVSKLKVALLNDPFYGVRIEAARALRSIHNDDAFSALRAGQDQSDARVRVEVAEALGKFYRAEALEAVTEILEREKNPEILARAINALSAYAEPGIPNMLMGFLKTDTYQNALAVAAVQAMRHQDDPSFVAPLIDLIRQRESQLPSFGVARVLGAVGHLARNNEDRKDARELLAEFTGRSNRAVRLGAIRALGTLGDSKAIPVLETFAAANKESPEQKAAAAAISAIRSEKRPSDELKDLRNEVLELKKGDQDLRKQIDDLKRKFEAGEKPSSATRPNRRRG